MKKILASILFVLFSITVSSQQISKEELIFLTPEWKGERFNDGRPKVPDDILTRMKQVTLEEAWAVLKGENFKYQYAEDWQTINPEVGMQNGGLASGIANSLGKIASMGLASAVFSPLMNITGSILASYWHKRPPISKSLSR